MKKIDIKSIIDQTFETFLNDLEKLLVIPSVRGDAKPEAPFGQAPKEALLKVNEIAESYGFTTQLIGNCVTMIAMDDTPIEESFGIVGHLDVVAAGEGWDYPAYGLTIDNGRLFGRGVLDNKGPAFACLFAMKLVNNLGLPLKHSVKILFGSDEESGSSDIALFLKESKAPKFSFTPDCKYPAVYAERGMLRLALKTSFEPGQLAELSEIRGEQHPSFIPSNLSATINQVEVKGNGKKAPSNAPEVGNNAIFRLMEAIKQQVHEPRLLAYLDWAISSMAHQHQGEGLGIAFSDEESGTLQLSPFEFQKQDNQLLLKLSIRYPVTVTKHQILEKLQEQLFEGTELVVERVLDSHYIDPTNEYVIALNDVYNTVMNDNVSPVTTTGATYARFIPNTIAFGPSFPGQKGIAHNANEYMDIKDMKKNIEIYFYSILALAGVGGKM
ncbi:Sapep family Mn(2+)-dependent dipeptidase [Vagococcus zengguangii]|uniref:M20 family metallopeptidase n=1 Tax=Vagococcus zengguangii TaxID=2571750 RepID=A0A4D7CPW8_9ENTE|nr:Sapep family Mn(2+)-dependent dipeptidase [Vagococcus zengguangii]QCI86195.1 M20 family metallopeptidase [Vagococcus zengguangii]